MENNDVDQPIEFLPCTLNSLTGDEIIPGRALTRPDGIILLLLASERRCVSDFTHGRTVGRAEEGNRTSKFFYDLLSSKMMMASYFARAADEKFSAAADGRIELGKVMSVLDEAIDAIVQGFDTTDFP